jgi:hypothetical protein
MTEDFNKWWNTDGLVEDNPYTRDTPAFWAWEGWQAAMKAEREACVVEAEWCIQNHLEHLMPERIRARGQG